MKTYKYSNLVEEMKNKKETQRSLSKIIGVNENSVRNKLAGRTSWTIGEIETLCDYFKKDYYELFGKE